MDLRINNSNTSFSGRCPELRAGRDVCHIIKTQFPSYSVSLLNKRIDILHQKGVLTGEKYDKIMKWWERRTETRNYKLENTLLHSNYKLFLDTMNFIKRTGIADCGQLADISTLILNLNGYKASGAFLKMKKGRDLDHAVCVFNRNNEPVKLITNDTIILDPWLGECDFAPKVLKKYKEVYNGYFKRFGLRGPDEPFIYLNAKESIEAKVEKHKPALKPGIIRKLRKKYPNLLIKDSKYTEPPKRHFSFFGLFKD